jgi:hypothetical protein
MLKTISKFFLSLLALTILCTVLWQQFIANTRYHCTDSLGVDYLLPGHWDPTTVAQVMHSSSMSEPDTIKTGWSLAGLWSLWFSFVGVSIFISIVLPRISWLPTRLPLAPNGANASSHG